VATGVAGASAVSTGPLMTAVCGFGGRSPGERGHGDGAS
jgi:hypothetical protein